MKEETEIERLTPDLDIHSHRVKLYQLTVDTNWEDKGTGFCTYQLGSEEKPDQIIVHSETDNSLLLTSNVLKKRFYQRQQETLIVWTEDDNRDLALSFQEPEGCEEIWQYIGKKTDLKEEEEEEAVTEIELPTPELANLTEILTMLTTINEKDKITNFITIDNYIEKLLPLFETMEDLEDLKDLYVLYKIVIQILVLNDQTIIEQLVSNDHIYTLMGILEYNPKYKNLKAKHREYIKKHEAIEPIVDLKDDKIKYKISQTFRLEYLSSVLQAEQMDTTLNNMIFQNQLEIVNFITNNHSFLNSLLHLELKESKIQFIFQMFALTKQMQNSIKLNLLKSLANYGLFDVLCQSFKMPAYLKSSLNLLITFSDLDIITVRNQLLITKNLIEILIEQFTSSQHHELKVQYFELIKLLLDPTNNTNPLTAATTNKTSPEMEEFLQLFYDNYAVMLIKPIESLEIKPILLKGPIEPLELIHSQAQLVFYIIEFLLFSIRNHGFRSKYIILSADLITKIQQLYRSKYEYIKLCALRFFRCCIGLSDEFYVKNLIKHNIFESTLRILLDTNGKDSLLNSACLELFEYIRKENIKPIILHLINQFGQVLDTISYISTCQQLRKRYDQLTEVQESNGSEDKTTTGLKIDQKANNNDGWSSSTVDEEEEDYFNGSDDEEEMPEEENNNLKRKSIEEEGKKIKKLKPSSEIKPTELPPLKSDDEEEDDVLINKKSPRQLPQNKKIVIKSFNIKKSL